MRTPIVLAALALGACSGGTDVLTDPATVRGAIVGTWTRLGEVPGSSERWTTTVADTVVTGSGQWTGEACCAGTVTVHGYVSGGAVHLDLAFYTLEPTPNATPRFTEHVDASLSGADDLTGTVSLDNGPSVAAHWRRGTNPF